MGTVLKKNLYCINTRFQTMSLNHVICLYVCRRLTQWHFCISGVLVPRQHVNTKNDKFKAPIRFSYAPKRQHEAQFVFPSRVYDLLLASRTRQHAPMTIFVYLSDRFVPSEPFKKRKKNVLLVYFQKNLSRSKMIQWQCTLPCNDLQVFMVFLVL